MFFIRLRNPDNDQYMVEKAPGPSYNYRDNGMADSCKDKERAIEILENKTTIYLVSLPSPIK